MNDKLFNETKDFVKDFWGYDVGLVNGIDFEIVDIEEDKLIKVCNKAEVEEFFTDLLRYITKYHEPCGFKNKCQQILFKIGESEMGI